MRERLATLGVEGGLIDKRIWAAFKHACEFSTSLFTGPHNQINQFYPDTVPVDYAAFARKRDKVHPNSLTYSSEEKIGTFWKHMRHKRGSDGKLPKRRDIQPKDLVEREGCIFEADKGVPLMLLLTKLQREQLQVCISPTISQFQHG